MNKIVIMENFITGHLIGQQVDIYCGGNDKFSGKIEGCADDVLTLESKPGVYTHIAIGKIIAIWRKTAETGEKKTHPKVTKSKKK